MTSYSERATPIAGRVQVMDDHRGWVSYMALVAIIGVSLVLLYLGGLVALNKAGALPPPPLVNSVCADIKLQFFREHPPVKPTFLIVGSSIAWRDIDSALIKARFPDTMPLNAGFCGAQLNQSAFVTHYFVKRFPTINTVLAVLEPHDFRACSKTPSELFNPVDADNYIFRRTWLYGLYFRYFDALSLERNVRHIRAVRDGRDLGDPMTFTKYGDGPVTKSAGRGLVYGRFDGYDASCFSDLHALAKSVEASGRQFVVATAPLNPDWVRKFDSDGSIHQEFVGGIRKALEGTGSAFWESEKTFATEPVMFDDAVHLMWPASKPYTVALTNFLAQMKARP